MDLILNKIIDTIDITTFYVKLIIRHVSLE